MKSYIYFVRCTASGLVKIGRAADMRERMTMLQIGSAAPLELVAFFVGNDTDEASIHQYFASARVRGEWFEPTDELLTFIDVIPNKQTFIPEDHRRLRVATRIDKVSRRKDPANAKAAFGVMYRAGVPKAQIIKRTGIVASHYTRYEQEIGHESRLARREVVKSRLSAARKATVERFRQLFGDT